MRQTQVGSLFSLAVWSLECGPMSGTAVPRQLAWKSDCQFNRALGPVHFVWSVRSAAVLWPRLKRPRQPKQLRWRPMSLLHLAGVKWHHLSSLQPLPLRFRPSSLGTGDLN
ncbi:uncharacterized protein LOC144578020 isoform X2 [Callithrix jacchus]